MDEVILHEPPAMGGVLAEQFRAVGVALRREGLVFGLCLLGLTLLILYMYLHAWHTHRDFYFAVSPDTAGALALLATALPISVWKGEEPSRRSYQWSLPVARGPHALVKVLFGWVWMSVGMAAYMAWGRALPLVFGAPVQGPYGGSEAAWRWAVPFTAATVMYLLGTVAVLLSDHPWRWLVGLSVAFLMVRGLSQVPGMEAVRAGLDVLWSGPYGLQAALTAKLFVQTDMVNAAGHTMHGVRSVVGTDIWLRATAVWLAVGLAATAVAAHVHQERSR